MQKLVNILYQSPGKDRTLGIFFPKAFPLHLNISTILLIYVIGFVTMMKNSDLNILLLFCYKHFNLDLRLSCSSGSAGQFSDNHLLTKLLVKY